MKRLIVIIFVLSCLFVNGQDLMLSDLKDAASKATIDEIDMVLRLKGYKLTSFPLRDSIGVVTYEFTKATNFGKIALACAFKKNNTFVVYALYDSDINFYKLKSECEKQENIHKLQEDNFNNSYTRYYCDSEFKCRFRMKETKEIGMTYTVYVEMNKSTCP